ncbi:hypothetical protein BH10PLA2_BH10PLA2_35230 [soil metagenome]
MTSSKATRQANEWGVELQRQQVRLRNMPAAGMDLLIATTFFSGDDMAGVRFADSWEGFGHIVNHMLDRGFTVLLNGFTASHLKSINRNSWVAWPAEVTVVDIQRRFNWPASSPNITVGADTMLRATAIAAAFIGQMENGVLLTPVAEPALRDRQSAWDEERRRKQSERMNRYWQKVREAEHSGNESH